jgi:hypothetical protein
MNPKKHRNLVQLLFYLHSASAKRPFEYFAIHKWQKVYYFVYYEENCYKKSTFIWLNMKLMDNKFMRKHTTK